MKSISHNVPRVVQGPEECVQSSAAQILAFYGITKSIPEIREEVPMLFSKDGRPLGTSFPHIALYFVELGFHTTMHVADLEIFDRRWALLSSAELLEKLEQRAPHLKHSVYDREMLDVYFDGYPRFLKAGGTITLPVVTHAYLRSLLEKGPVYASVDYQLLNNCAKYSYDSIKQEYVEDDISGTAITHAIIISGFTDTTYTIVDPDYHFGGVRTIDADHFLGAFYLAQLTFDNVLISLEKK